MGTRLAAAIVSSPRHPEDRAQDWPPRLSVVGATLEAAHATDSTAVQRRASRV